MTLGEPGTEQFEVVTLIDGVEVGRRPIHDPFGRTTVVLQPSRLQALRQLLWPKPIKVEVKVGGSPGAEELVLSLDPAELSRRTLQISEQRRATQSVNLVPPPGSYHGSYLGRSTDGRK